jgi:hypothetical protein
VKRAKGASQPLAVVPFLSCSGTSKPGCPPPNGGAANAAFSDHRNGAFQMFQKYIFVCIQSIYIHFSFEILKRSI